MGSIMRRLAALGPLYGLAAVVVLAQVSVTGGGTTGGVSTGGASFWNGSVPPSNTIGSNGDFYLSTSTYCLYGPKAAGAWPPTCVSLIGQAGLPGPPLGYVAENTADKGAASGYAPLNSSAQVPLINLPIIPYTQISGVQLALGFTPLSPANNLGDLSNAAAARSNLGLVVGTNVEPHSALLDGFAGLAANGIVAVSSGSAVSGTLSGDVTTNGLASTVNSVGGSTAANLHNAELLANAATSSNTNSSIVMRDHSGNINATQVYAGGAAVENTANKGALNGYAPLDGSGLLPAANLPANGSFTGRISTSAAGAGAFMMTAGAGQTPPPNTVGLQAPPSVPTSFNCTWWGIPVFGVIHATATTPCILSPSLLVASDLDPSMPAVVTSGSYTDLLNLPTIPAASNTSPTVDGMGTVGTSGAYARADHVHPTDTSRQAALGYTPLNATAVGVANGVAPLDLNGLLPVANLTQYTPPYTGSAPRTFTSKLGDVVSLADFGAVGNDITDDTAAWNAAVKATPPGGTLIGTPGAVYAIKTQAVYSSGDSTLCSIPLPNTIHIDLWGSKVDATFLPANTGGVFCYLPQTSTGHFYQQTAYPAANINQGDTTVTLVTAGNSSNFTVGDLVYLVGEATDLNDRATNFVQYISGGVISLAFPTGKNYWPFLSSVAGVTGLSGSSGTCTLTFTTPAGGSAAVATSPYPWSTWTVTAGGAGYTVASPPTSATASASCGGGIATLTGVISSPTIADVQSVAGFDTSIANGTIWPGQTQAIVWEQGVRFKVSHLTIYTNNATHEPIQDNYMTRYLLDHNDITGNAGQLLEFSAAGCIQCKADSNTATLIPSSTGAAPIGSAMASGEGSEDAIFVGNTVTHPGGAAGGIAVNIGGYNTLTANNTIRMGPSVGGYAVATNQGSWSPKEIGNTITYSSGYAFALGASDYDSLTGNDAACVQPSSGTVTCGGINLFSAHAAGPSTSITGGSLRGLTTYGILIEGNPGAMATQVTGVNISGASTVTGPAGIYVVDPGSQQTVDPILTGNQISNYTTPVTFVNPAHNANRVVIGNPGVADWTPPTFVVGTGTANAQVATFSPPITTLAVGQTYCWLPSLSNTTTAPTLNINALGAKPLTRFGQSTMPIGYLSTTQVGCVLWDGTGMEYVSPHAPLSADVIAGFTGTCNNTTFLRADGTCVTPSGSSSALVTVQFTTPVCDLICAGGGDPTILVNGTIQQAYIPAGAPGGTGYTNGDTWTGTGGSCTTEPSGLITAASGPITALSIVTPGVCTAAPTGITTVDGGSGALVAFSSCNNTTDATAGTSVFASYFPIAASVLAAGNSFSVLADLSIWTTSTPEGLSHDGTLKYQTFSLDSLSANLTPTASLTNASFAIAHDVTFPTVGASPTATARTNYTWNGTPGWTSAFYNNIGTPSGLYTTISNGLYLQWSYLSNGVATATYTSGPAVSGAAGTTCVLTAFNGAGSGALGTVYLTSTNTIASGTPIYLTARGQGYTAVSTSATQGSGTATCTAGSAVIVGTLGGAWGNMAALQVFKVTQGH